MRKRYIQSADNGVGQTQNRATRRQTGELPSNEPTKVTRAATRPFPAKKKATPKNDAAVRKGVRILLEQSLSLLIFYICSIKFQKNTKNPPLRKWIGTI